MAEETFPPASKIPKLPDNLGIEEKKKEALTLGARLLFIVVAVVGIGGLGWGAWRFNQNIKAPFLPINNGSASNTNSEISDLIALQTKDSDNDDLSDYDEINVYKTSAYLEDTDSDGYKDKQEIDTGHDPNCPNGQNCGLPETSSGTNTNTSMQRPDTSGLDQLLAGNCRPTRLGSC